MKKHFLWIVTIIVAMTMVFCFLGCKDPEPIPDTTPPAEVTNFAVNAVNGKAVLNWTNPTTIDFAGVQISMNPAEGILASPISLGKNATSFTVPGLEVDCTYRFTIKTFDNSQNYSNGATQIITIENNNPSQGDDSPGDSGNDNPSVGGSTGGENEKPGDTDTTAPAQVTNLSAVYDAQTLQITISWTNPQDEDFAGTVLEYGKTSSTEKTTLTFDKSYSSTVIQGIAADDSEYSFKIVAIDTVGNTSEVANTIIITSAIYKTPIIKEIIVPSFAVTFYCKEFPITIVGENFTTSNIFRVGLGGSIKNIKIISDTKVTAVITFINSIGAQSPCNIEIPIYCDDIEGIAVLKIIEKEKCFSIGDILNAYGERLKVDNLYYGVPDSYYSRVGVVVSTSYGGAMGKVLGLRQGIDLSWASANSTGYYTEFSEIESYYSDYTFSGDLDGSDNWDYICSMDPEGTLGSINKGNNYPAFWYAETYGGIYGGEFRENWYIPTIKELVDIHGNLDIIQKSLAACDGFEIRIDDLYWSSNQSSTLFPYGYNLDNYGFILAYAINFSRKLIYEVEKDNNVVEDVNVLVLHEADASNFHDYNYGSPQITSVTMPTTIGEGYTGIIPVTIKGKNFTLPDVKEDMFLFDGASVTNIEIISDTLIQALITTNVVVGTNSVTVSYGSSGGTGSFTGIESELCFTDSNIGNIILDDGTVVPLNQYNSSSMNPIAIVCGLKYNGGQVLGMGLYNSESEAWAHQTSIGCDLKFEGIGVNYSGSKDKGYIIEGDLDGFDNWDYICNIEPVDTTDSVRKYPVFYFANNYAKRAGLTETKYAENWFVPSIDELYNLYKNKDIIQKTLLKVGKFKLESVYWSSSHTIDDPLDVVLMDFDYDEINDDDKYFEYNVLVLRAFNPKTEVEKPKAKIESVNLDTSFVGEGYVGTIPITIIGENLLYWDITSNDTILTNISYISDTEVSAEINCDGILGSYSVTINCGFASDTVKYEVIEGASLSVGDILFTDGTKIKSENVKYGIPESQRQKAFGIVASSKYNGGKIILVGLKKGTSLQWAPSGTTGYNTNFEEIEGTTTSGDMDGSDNWDYICSVDSTGTLDPATNYPAFNFANTYGSIAGLTGTKYENGWYLPTIAELCQIYENRTVIQESLTAAGGFTICTSNFYYWSSSLSSSDDTYAYILNFNKGEEELHGRSSSNDVLVVQSFNCEQFENYEVTTTPSITNVTIETVGKGYTGDLKIVITGDNLKGHPVICSDVSFGNVKYISDTEVTATITCNSATESYYITVTCGSSSKTCIVKVLSYGIGYIVLSDGSFVAKDNFNSRIMTPIAVVVGFKNDGAQALSVGLQRSLSLLQWAPSGTTGYNSIFKEIDGTTTSGDMDGSDNWDYICSVDPTGTLDASTNYPVFNFANTYGSTAGLTGTKYENGWYLPTIAELCQIYENRTVIQESLTVAGGFTIDRSVYWSSSTYPYGRSYAYSLDFSNGSGYDRIRRENYRVLVLRVFNAQ